MFKQSKSLGLFWALIGSSNFAIWSKTDSYYTLGLGIAVFFSIGAIILAMPDNKK